MLVLQGPGQGNGGRVEWGPDEQDQLSAMAAKFKKANDKIGLYLCALAEEEINRAQEKGGCMCAGIFYVSLALACEAGAAHSIAHILLPQVQDMFRAAWMEKSRTEMERDLQSTGG